MGKILVSGDTKDVCVELKERIMEEMDSGEPYTASEIADGLGEPRRTVTYHLRELAENGEVSRKKHSENRVTYWRE